MREEDKQAMDDNHIKARPSLAFYHPNNKGTGSAIQFKLYPASANLGGYINVRFAKQISIGSSSNDKLLIYPKFDWEECIEFDWGFDEVSKILEVLRGYEKSLQVNSFDYLQNGIKYDIIGDRTIGYYLRIESEYGNFSMRLESYEAVGLECVLDGSLIYLAFGNPEKRNS